MIPLAWGGTGPGRGPGAAWPPAEEALRLLRRLLPRLVEELEGCGEPMALEPELLEVRHQDLRLGGGGSLLQAEPEQEHQIMGMIYAETASERLRTSGVVVLSGSSEKLGAADSFLKSDCRAMGL
jgi:hypothetical protein